MQKTVLKTVLLLLHLTLLVTSQRSAIVFSKTGRDCLHGTLGLEGIRRAQNDINVNAYFMYRGLRCVWLHFFRIDTCARLSESIHDNSYFVCANGYGYAGRIAASLPDPTTTTTTNTTVADLTASVTTTLPTTTTTLTTTTATTNTPTTTNYTTTAVTNSSPVHCNLTTPTVLVLTLESYNPGEQERGECACTC